jgi:hypothetical protein
MTYTISLSAMAGASITVSLDRIPVVGDLVSTGGKNYQVVRVALADGGGAQILTLAGTPASG